MFTHHFFRVPTLFLLICLFFVPQPATSQASKERFTLAILPFDLIAPEPSEYLQTGSLQMLSSRLHWKDTVTIVDRHLVAQHLSNIPAADARQKISAIHTQTGSDYILAGTITQFADAFSIDAQLYDMNAQTYMTFSEQSGSINDVIPKINVIAARINKTVFNRQSAMYDNLVRQEKEKAEQWKRQNPEKLMPVFPDEPREKSSVWKFWEYL